MSPHRRTEIEHDHKMSERILEIGNLEVTIPVTGGLLRPVQNISLHVDRGETLCIVGESGCGKSLTSLAIMDLLPQKAKRTASMIQLDGEDLGSTSEYAMSDIRGNRMSMIFQEPMTSLNPAFSIGNQLTEALRRHKKASRSEATDRAVYLLEKVGISAAASRLGQYPHQLSGGLRQRVMIAMALMCGPDLIIADEPTTALDVTIQAQILHLLAELQDEFDMGLILITHDLGVVARIADRVMVMYAGEIIESGSAEAIFNSPAHPYTSGLLECIPVPGKTKPGEALGAIPGIVPSLIGTMPGCHFASRCPLVEEACHTTTIELRDASAPDHQFRCRLSDEQTAAAHFRGNA
jgi:peptide/nickel transport system ATP-binding protein